MLGPVTCPALVSAKVEETRESVLFSEPTGLPEELGSARRRVVEEATAGLLCAPVVRRKRSVGTADLGPSSGCGVSREEREAASVLCSPVVESGEPEGARTVVEKPGPCPTLGDPREVFLPVQEEGSRVPVDLLSTPGVKGLPQVPVGRELVEDTSLDPVLPPADGVAVDDPPSSGDKVLLRLVKGSAAELSSGPV